MQKAHVNIGWKNYPSDRTPIDEQNLNRMDRSIDAIDDRVIVLDGTMATKTEISEFFREVAYDGQTGILSFTRKNGAVATIDTPMEKIQTGIYYDPVTEMLALPLIDGTQIQVDLSRLITEYEFLDSGTVAFSVQAGGKIAAIVKEGSIGERHLRPDYLAEIKAEAARAQGSQAEAGLYAKKAQSYAVGGTGTREGEDADNARYYAEKSEQNAARSGWMSFELNDAGHVLIHKHGIESISFALTDGRMEVTFV